jgi:hypothetical protein
MLRLLSFSKLRMAKIRGVFVSTLLIITNLI